MRSGATQIAFKRKCYLYLHGIEQNKRLVKYIVGNMLRDLQL